VKRRTIVLPGAAAEFADATAWYDGRRPGLGVEFALAVRAAFAEIAEQPLSWPVWQHATGYRYLVLARFPYTVFYRVTDQEVLISAVSHGKREPGYWVGRDKDPR
jgi:toxin ParE1/3/4